MTSDNLLLFCIHNSLLKSICLSLYRMALVKQGRALSYSKIFSFTEQDYLIITRISVTNKTFFWMGHTFIERKNVLIGIIY